jgi:nitrogenase molybdenum-cofactor synthesis protein NifE
MGILWALLSVGDLMVLEYGPTGTTHYGIETLAAFGLPLSRNLFAAHMDQDTVVMGDTAPLSEAIRELDETYHPKYLTVLGSSVSSLIGADIQSVCSAIQDDVAARLIPIDHCDFVSEFSEGLRIALTALVKSMSKPADRLPGTFNILGVSPDAYGAQADAAEIVRLMEEGFGWRLNAALPWTGGINGINGFNGFETAARAALNLVIRDEAIPAADWLREQYGTPTLVGVPYGYAGTLRWLERIAERIQSLVNPTLRTRLTEKAASLASQRLSSGAQRFAVIGVYSLVKGLSDFLQREAGLTPMFRICSHSARTVNAPDPSVQFAPDEKPRMGQITNLRDTILLADDVSLQLAHPSVRGIRASHPRLLRDRDDAPAMDGFCGERGADLCIRTAAAGRCSVCEPNAL